MKLKEIYNKIILQEYSNRVTQQLLDKFKDEKPGLSATIINAYIKRFSEIKNSQKVINKDITTYSWDELEKIVDKHRKSAIKNTTVEFKNAKPIYEKDGLEIYLANTKRACIYYGTGYNFCISSRGDYNLYQYYRFNHDSTSDINAQHGNTIYFVFDKNKRNTKNGDKFNDPNHLLVIMIGDLDYDDNNLNNIVYLVTDADNEGEESMYWNDILSIQPKLKGLQKIFKPQTADKKEVSEQEILNKFSTKLYELNKNLDSSNAFLMVNSNDNSITKESIKNIFNGNSSRFTALNPDDNTKLITQIAPSKMSKEEWFDDLVKTYVKDEYEDGYIKCDDVCYRKNINNLIKKDVITLNDRQKNYLMSVLDLIRERDIEIFKIKNT